MVLAVAHHARGRRRHLPERVQRPLRLALLQQAQVALTSDDRQDGQRVAEALHERGLRRGGEQAQPGRDRRRAEERQHREVGDLGHDLAPPWLRRLLGQAVAPDANQAIARLLGQEAAPQIRVPVGGDLVGAGMVPCQARRYRRRSGYGRTLCGHAVF